jgi:hypothetical protein
MAIIKELQKVALVRLTRYGGNDPGKILKALANVFDTDIASEYEPQYWGFDTQEEWERAWTSLTDNSR